MSILTRCIPAQDFRLIFLLSATVFVSCTSGSPLKVKNDDSAGVSLPFGAIPLFHFYTYYWRGCVLWFHFNPLTPKSDQSQISPAASPEILHHTVWRTWHFIAYQSDERRLLLPILTTSLIHFSLKGWENVLFELGSERVNLQRIVTSFCLQTWFPIKFAKFRLLVITVPFECGFTALLAFPRKEGGKMRTQGAHAAGLSLRLGVLIFLGWGVNAARSWKPLPYFRPKYTIYHTLFKTWLSKCIPCFRPCYVWQFRQVLIFLRRTGLRDALNDAVFFLRDATSAATRYY